MSGKIIYFCNSCGNRLGEEPAHVTACCATGYFVVPVSTLPEPFRRGEYMIGVDIAKGPDFSHSHIIPVKAE